MNMEHSTCRTAPRFSRVLHAGLAGLLVGISGCQVVNAIQASGNQVVGSGRKASDSRAVPAFSGIEVAGSAQVDYRVGSRRSVLVETDDNLLNRVETVVRDGRLCVNYKGSVSTRLGLRVQVVAPSCEEVTLSGSGDIQISGLKQERLNVDLSGSGRITAAGEAATASAVLSGSGRLDLSRVRGSSVTAEITGSGVVLAAPTGTLDARVSGSGSVRYSGSPKAVRRQITGSGSVTRG